MSHLSNKVFLVLGSGPGIGRATASFFASKSHSKIGLVARNGEKLAQDKAAVEEAAKKAGRSVEVKTWVTDLADEAALVKTLNEVDGFGKTEVIFFNGARVVLSSLLETPASEIEYDFKVDYWLC
jgi:NAD(P)-dependent dehydrogenase (short-subunit alcohol dehydrogenase family)